MFDCQECDKRSTYTMPRPCRETRSMFRLIILKESKLTVGGAGPAVYDGHCSGGPTGSCSKYVTGRRPRRAATPKKVTLLVQPATRCPQTKTANANFPLAPPLGRCESEAKSRVETSFNLRSVLRPIAQRRGNKCCRRCESNVTKSSNNLNQSVTRNPFADNLHCAPAAIQRYP